MKVYCVMRGDLRCRLKDLKSWKLITDGECEFLCKALDDMEQHNKDVLEQIRDEIKAERDDTASGCVAKYSYDEGYYGGLGWALRIINKYMK